MALNTKDSKYNEQFELWRQVRAAIDGKYKVVSELVSCLPGPQYRTMFSYSGMTKEQQAHAQQCNQFANDRVQSYWSRGRFFNATGRTHDSLDGMIWSQEPESQIPARLEYLENNANGAGSGLREVVQKITDDVISIGRYGVLVDMPQSDSRPTQAQQESGEMAARFILYKAEQIVYFRVSDQSNAVDEIRLEEVKSVQKNNFEWEDKVFVRRLVMIDGIYHNQLYTEKDDLVSDVTPIANGSTLTEIPFQFFGADNNSPEYSKVPLYDLANINLGHFVLDCDNRDNLHYHGQGMTNIYTALDPEEFAMQNPNGLDVGAKGKNVLGVNDKVEILQIDATGAIASEMLRDEQRMIMAGAQLVQDTPTNQTLGAKEMEFGASTSTLKRISYNISDGMINLLEWAALFMGVDEEVWYRLNTDFMTDDLSPQMIQQIFSIVQGGVLPKETIYEVARKAGFTKLTDEEIEERASRDELDLPGMTEEEAIAQAVEDEE